MCLNKTVFSSIVCPHCEFTEFTDESSLNDHIRQNHFDKEGDDLGCPLGSNVGVVAVPGADVPADLTVAVPGGDDVVAQPDARALALAMLEQVLPTMVRTYAVEDLTAVKTWLMEAFKVTDVELLIEDPFLFLSSVSLDLLVMVDLLHPVPGTIERDLAIVVSKSLAEIQSSAEAAAAAHLQNITPVVDDEELVFIDVTLMVFLYLIAAGAVASEPVADDEEELVFTDVTLLVFLYLIAASLMNSELLVYEEDDA